jgi:predicted nucleic acid-binding protein
MFDFLMMAVAGGLYIVPLYAQVQHQGAPSHLARLIAAANIMSALFMVASAVGTVLLLAMRFSIPEIFLTVSLANLLVSIYICRLLPDALIRSILCTVLTFLFRVEAVTLMEIELGILRIERRDATQGARLRVWMNDYILPEFADRTLPVDTAVALRCAGLHVPDPFSERDAFIAATALVHGMTLVTRDLADFKAAAVPLFNPWNAAQ